MPELLPQPRPFAEAIAYHRGRTPIGKEEFSKLTNEARLRAFTIAGLTRQSALLEASRMIDSTLERGGTLAEFAEEFGALLDAQGGMVLSPKRIELIFRNNLAIAYAAGRFRQATHPDVVAERPYFRYPLGPNDDRTTNICKSIQGKVARHDSPFWKHFWPPNHHGERHLKPTSMTEEQAIESGQLLEEGEEFPFIEEENRRALPDPGWDFEPGLITADDAEFVRAASELGSEIATKTADSYGLAELSGIPLESIPDAPAFTPKLTGLTNEYEYAWTNFQEAVGIDPAIGATWAIDYAGDGVRINRQTFEHMLGLDTDSEEVRKAKRDRARFFSFLLPTLVDPTEVWFVPTRTADGRMTFIKRYIALFEESDRGIAFQTYLERTPEGWLMKTGHAQRESSLEAQRRGLLAYSKAPKKGETK